MSIGIETWGVWIPRYRLTADVVGGAFGTRARGRRALASHDEDALTMAVEALRRCGVTADALYFASTSAPYAEKLHAVTAAAALDWSSGTATVDIGGSQWAAVSALQAAVDAMTAGRVTRAAVVASDVRPVAPATPHELAFGDGAVALALGQEPVLSYRGWGAVSAEIMDVWRLDGGIRVDEADAKFVEQRSYAVHQPAALRKALAGAGWNPADLARAYLWAPDSRIAGLIAKAAGLQPAQLPAPVFDDVGALGVAQPFASLVADLPNLKPGDRIALAGHGSGAEVTLWEATERLLGANREAWARATAASAPWPNYGAFLKARGLIAGERLDPFTAPPVLDREEAVLFRRHGAACTQCAEFHYPPQPLCRRCRGSRFEMRRLGDEATVVTYTADHLYPTPLPPTYMVSADVDGGGRFYGQLTDAHGEPPAIGDRLAFCFRRIHTGGGFVNYFWKLRKAR